MMKAAISKYVLLVAALAATPAAASDAVRIDGGDETGWETDNWYVQVDGVMGGKSTGNMEFLDDNTVMKFTGDINLDGGGFSSVRRRMNLDLTGYAGVVVTLEADIRGTGEGTAAPIGIHLQLDDRTSRYDFSSAFSIPLSSGETVTSVYLPVESFDRGTWIGFTCQNNCVFDPSQINGISVYVLFQEGSFDVRLRSIEAVTEPRAFPLPEYDVLESTDDVVALLGSTISSGGGLYDKGYVELCIAMYWSVLNTLLSSDVLSDPVKVVICAGLEHFEYLSGVGSSKESLAWQLRFTIDALLSDLQGTDRITLQDWLPTRSRAATMDVTCFGRTSAAPGFMYDPTNEYMLVSDSEKTPAESTAETPSNTEETVEDVQQPEELLSDVPEVENIEEIDTSAIESNQMTSGSLAVSNQGFKSIVLGVMLLEVMELVWSS